MDIIHYNDMNVYYNNIKYGASPLIISTARNYDTKL